MSGAEIFGIVAAVPGIIDVCIQYGQFLKDKVELFIHASEHASLRLFVVDLVQGGIYDALKFLRDAYAQLEQRFKDTLGRLIPHLRDLILKALQAFPEVKDDGRISAARRAKYAMYDAGKIDEAIAELEVWSDRFVKRTDMYMKFVFDRRIAPGAATVTAIGETLAKVDLEGDSAQRLMRRLDKVREERLKASGPVHIIEPPKTEDTPIAGTDLYLTTDGNGLAEYHSYGGMKAEDVALLRRRVRDTATELRAAESSKMHILHARGFSEDAIRSRFVLYLDMPIPGSNPRSLRSLLADPLNKYGRKHSLSDRVVLARSLATAILYVHSSGYVHKNVRPENVIVFEPKDGTAHDRFPYRICPAYLTGYDGVRKEDGGTQLNDPEQWAHRIYLPAGRLAPKPERERFSWRHDIYSLGVILLEIALWEDFSSKASATGKLLAAVSDPVSGMVEVVEKRQKYIASILGDRYAAALAACLSMLGSKQGSVDGLVKDEDGIELGSTYISQVLDHLEAIVV